MPEQPEGLSLGELRDDQNKTVGIMLFLGSEQAELSPDAALEIANELLRLVQLINPPRLVLSS